MQLLDSVEQLLIKAFHLLVGPILQLLQRAHLVCTQALGELFANQGDPSLIAGPPCRVILVGYRLTEDLQSQHFH
jgi:hypothetical protein